MLPPHLHDTHTEPGGKKERGRGRLYLKTSPVCQQPAELGGRLSETTQAVNYVKATPSSLARFCHNKQIFPGIIFIIIVMPLSGTARQPKGRGKSSGERRSLTPRLTSASRRLPPAQPQPNLLSSGPPSQRRLPPAPLPGTPGRPGGGGRFGSEAEAAGGEVARYSPSPGGTGMAKGGHSTLMGWSA